MVEMEMNRHPAARRRGARAVRIVADEKSCEPSHAVLGFTNLLIGRTPIRKLEQLTLIVHADVQIEFVEGRLDGNRAHRIAILEDGLGELLDAEDRTGDHLGTRAPS